MKASFFGPQICVNHILQDVQMIQKRKEKEVDELASSRTNKNQVQTQIRDKF